MFCKKCGAYNADESKNCKACGAGIENQPADGVRIDIESAPVKGEVYQSAGAANVNYSVADAAVPKMPKKTHLAPAILVMILCSRIFGAIALVFSLLTDHANKSCDYAGAEEYSRNSAIFCWVGFGLGLAVILIYLVIFVGFIVLAGQASMMYY